MVDMGDQKQKQPPKQAKVFPAEPAVDEKLNTGAPKAQFKAPTDKDIAKNMPKVLLETLKLAYGIPANENISKASMPAIIDLREKLINISMSNTSANAIDINLPSADSADLFRENFPKIWEKVAKSECPIEFDYDPRKPQVLVALKKQPKDDSVVRGNVDASTP